ncbi:hypothetical protein E2C01_051931 [Portunus trituberculatus]|uniref:Uncharacterized protein n=1 Tax=Portunus trituberculatus TaxID=210409 RepID=A0A5B7GK41_PORTR|nr:hypothetical protein [Portunus trituberculatus]
MDPGHLLRGVPFLMAPLEVSVFRHVPSWLRCSCLRGVVSTGAEVLHQPPGDDGCFPGSAVLSAGIVRHGGVTHVREFDSGGLFMEFGGTQSKSLLGLAGIFSGGARTTRSLFTPVALSRLVSSASESVSGPPSSVASMGLSALPASSPPLSHASRGTVFYGLQDELIFSKKYLENY